MSSSIVPHAGSVQTRPIASPTRASDRWLMKQVARRVAAARVAVRLWDGTEAAGVAAPVGRILVRDRGALLGLVLDPELRFGEAYTDGRLEVQGDLVAVLEALIRAAPPEADFSSRTRRLRHRPTHTLSASRQNVHHHYDLGNDFYRLWLDREMVYTCAYFPTREATLEDAQTAKMEYVCRKLRLRAGERVVEAGCGWGALALYMARTRGVRVEAWNVSSEQVAFSRERAAREGLEDRVTFVEDDYRNIGSGFDVFVSVGMLEHVGRENYPLLGRVIDRALPSGRGRGLLHFIGRDVTQPLNAWMERHIFPGAYPATLAEAMSGVLEPARLSALDVENLRLHYAETARCWRERFEASRDEVVRRFDDRFARAWHLYLAGTEAAFRAGSLQLFQITFARAGDNSLPFTRRDLYAEGPGGTM